MTETLPALLILVGAAFMLIAAIGVTRLPDLYTRMSATSKAATLGASCALLAGGVHFMETGVSGRAIAAIGFVLLSAPVAAHMIGRAAYTTGVPLWKGTLRDELRDGRGPVLSSTPPDHRGGSRRSP
jgi:multicomponent Na+:H+ antiporter subunit G